MIPSKMDSAEQKECKVKAGWAPSQKHKELVSTCLGESVKYECPAANGVAKMEPDYVKEQGIMCKSCSHTEETQDLDAEKNKFWVVLKWGPLFSAGDASKNMENWISGYKVYWVDQYGRRLGDALGTMPVKDSDDSCCNTTNMKYSMGIQGTLPKAGHHFEIRPVLGTFELPHGVATKAFADSERKRDDSKWVSGAFTVTVSDPKNFQDHPKTKEACREAISKTIGVDKDHVIITKIALATRRLRDNGRRLAEGGVVVEYKIYVPADSTLKTDDISAKMDQSKASTDKLMVELQKRMKENKIEGVTVTAVTISEKPKQMDNGMMGTGDMTSSAFHAVRPGFLAAFVAAAVGVAAFFF